MRRRRFLKTAPAVGVVGLAGCPANDSGSENTSESSPSKRIDLPWSQLPGPPGGPVTNISLSRADPDAMYAATRTAGIFASDDGGASWIQGFSGQHHRSRIWASPYEPQTAFTEREVTENGGRKWHHPEWSDLDRFAPVPAPATSLGGPTVGRVYNVEWDPFKERTIYASTPEGLYLTSNGGRSWERRSINGIELPPHFRGWDFAVHPNREGLIVAGVGNKVAKSTDRGKNWSKFDLGEEHSHTENRFIRGVEFVDAGSDAIYLAIEEDGVYRLSNGTLTEVAPDLPTLVFPQTDLPLILSADRQKLYFIAGRSDEMYPVRQWWDDRTLYVYDANSEAIDTLNLPVKPNAVTTHPTEDPTLFIGGNSWIHKTTDGGQTWNSLSNGFVDHYLATVAVNPSHPETVFPGSICSTGLSVSRDSGETFEWKRSGLNPWHQGDFSEHYIMQIAPVEERVYATTRAGLLISDDNGDSWQMLENRFSGQGEWEQADTHLHGLAVHPEEPDVVYVGTGRGGVGSEDTDAFDGTKIWKSTDGGHTWTERTAGFPTDAETTVHDIVVNPHDPDIVYAATNAADNTVYMVGGEGVGLYRSQDGGHRWNELPTPFEHIHAVSVDATETELLYASTPTPLNNVYFGGVYRSSDGGESWERILDHETHGLMAHPTEGGVLFSGSRKYRDNWEVLVSTDGGDTWAEGNLRIRASDSPFGPEKEYDARELHSDYWGSASGQIMWFALDRSKSLLYAATRGVGLWQADTSVLK